MTKVEEINQQTIHNLDFIFSIITAIGSAATGIGFFMLIQQLRLNEKSTIMLKKHISIV